ncbi:DMT family transporter [Psychromarinibacter sp. C21-152]|uniref:DMT family transporter n=1 Tax=Psychromarinibacter sediminicola TaxID=3033385 RepID=A0AAE3TA06_9RHOB|nr:DMT family transporter [Psychromarinibacter sediminicola]MDF0601105.1 DMT family transporter [Psychromarinibacter sediminicola]
MSDASGSNLKGALFALAGFALFASHDVVVKWLGGSLSTFQIIFFSVLLSLPLVMLMLMRDATEGTLIPVHPWWTALRTGSAVVTGLCVFYAFATLPLAQVYAIIFAMPLIITVLSIPILGERVGWHRWAAVVVGLCGVLVVLRPGAAPLTLGHLAAMVGAFTGSFVSIVVRKIGQDERNAVLMLYPLMANFLVMAAVLPFVYVPMQIGELGLIGLMAVLAFAASRLMIQAYKAGDAAIVAPMQYSQMIWAAIYGSLFFAERIDGWTWTGTGIIVASGVYIVLRESLSGISRMTPVLRTRSRAETGTSPRVSMLLRLAGRPPLRRK